MFEMSITFIVLVCFVITVFLIGISSHTRVKGKSQDYVLAGRNVSLFMMITTLVSQSVDGNGTLGNASLTYTGGFWRGASIPIGLSICLLLTGRFFAKPLRQMSLLTLPDFYRMRYNKIVELLASSLCIVSFVVLLAGELSACAWIFSTVTDFSYTWMLAVFGVIIVAYTFAGGLYSSIYTDMLNHLYVIVFVAASIYLLLGIGPALLGKIPENYVSFSGLFNIRDNALGNWATIMALGLGDIVALDFMGRVLSGRTPRVSATGCYIAALYTLIAGICISMIGIIAKAYYPALSNPRMVYPIMALQRVPFLLGTLMLIGAMGASMSCANGAVLAISSVLARNVIQNTANQIPDSRLLWFSRFMSFPTIAFASFLAFAIPEPGTLLILAFDIVFAGCFVPLALGVYWGKGNSLGAISSILVGSTSRLLLYFSIPTNLVGLDTLIPPALSLAAFVAVSYKTHPKGTSAFIRQIV